MRTQAEILQRKNTIQSEDVFGFAAEILIGSLDFEHAHEFLKAGTIAADWHPALTDEEITDDAGTYLVFAMGKAEAHRGISASRSISKLTEYAWLLGRDDVVTAMQSAPYENYGAPKLWAFAQGMGWQRTWDEQASESLARMADGKPCHGGCDEGCGS